MTFKGILLCLLVVGVFHSAKPHHLRHRSSVADISDDIVPTKSRRGLQSGLLGKNGSEAEKDRIPYSYKKLDKMMKKAILQIILGELHPADMMLLKALNYTLEEVMAIREHELTRIKEEEEFEARVRKQHAQELLTAKYQAAMHRRSSIQRKKTNRENSFEAYNRQAVYDYETDLGTSSSKLDYDESKGTEDDRTDVVTEESFRQNFDRAMEPHVVFKIRYDDSEFDSGSDERSRNLVKNHRAKTIFKIEKARSGTSDPFQSSGSDGEYAGGTGGSVDEIYGTSTRSSDLEKANREAVVDYENLVPGSSTLDTAEQTNKREFASHEEFERALNGSRLEDLEQRNESATTETTGVKLAVKEEEEEEEESKKRVTEYEGLEWVGGDVYRVVPEAMEALMNYEDEQATVGAPYDNRDDDNDDDEILRQNSYSTLGDVFNDTFEYQNDATELTANSTDNQNLTSYQRLAMAQRRDQGQKAIEDIKLRVLAMTGRFNLTSSNNRVQRERLTMFSPICQLPRNTDPEAWADPFSMNMYFQMNLTTGEHVLAAKLRLFKLPQDIVTSPSSSTYEEEEEDEKKIRVSVYFYTKSLKKHRAKKRLMDSVVTPLTSQGTHLALDVRQSLRFWRPNGQHGHSSNGNHGLVVQVEDQDGRPLKPSHYIQEPSCQTSSTGPNTDEKTSTSLPFSSEPVLVTFAS